ncbi:hypothetical protein SAMN04487843_11531 [Methylobacterium sp. ap11]|nr:hypothetical protein SAMN04487843_11531 [Methylobacterium sp. ap11]
MRSAGVDLTDVNYVLRTGHVYHSDFRDEGGGLWDVRGKTTENVGLNVSLTVVSSEYRVRIIGVEKQQEGRSYELCAAWD